MRGFNVLQAVAELPTWLPLSEENWIANLDARRGKLLEMRMFFDENPVI
jgi:hypothetical protein